MAGTIASNSSPSSSDGGRRVPSPIPNKFSTPRSIGHRPGGGAELRYKVLFEPGFTEQGGGHRPPPTSSGAASRRSSSRNRRSIPTATTRSSSSWPASTPTRCDYKRLIERGQQSTPPRPDIRSGTTRTRSSPATTWSSRTRTAARGGVCRYGQQLLIQKRRSSRAATSLGRARQEMTRRRPVGHGVRARRRRGKDVRRGRLHALQPAPARPDRHHARRQGEVRAGGPVRLVPRPRPDLGREGPERLQGALDHPPERQPARPHRVRQGRPRQARIGDVRRPDARRRRHPPGHDGQRPDGAGRRDLHDRLLSRRRGHRGHQRDPEHRVPAGDHVFLQRHAHAPRHRRHL